MWLKCTCDKNICSWYTSCWKIYQLTHKNIIFALKDCQQTGHKNKQILSPCIETKEEINVTINLLFYNITPKIYSISKTPFCMYIQCTYIHTSWCWFQMHWSWDSKILLSVNCPCQERTPIWKGHFSLQNRKSYKSGINTVLPIGIVILWLTIII